MVSQFTKDVLEIISCVPKGKVMTYGEVAKCAGNNRGAREVARILHTLTEKHNLPWQRIINAKGEVAIRNVALAKTQRGLLEGEGIVFVDDKVDLAKYMHRPGQNYLG